MGCQCITGQTQSRSTGGLERLISQTAGEPEEPNITQGKQANCSHTQQRQDFNRQPWRTKVTVLPTEPPRLTAIQPAVFKLTAQHTVLNVLWNVKNTHSNPCFAHNCISNCGKYTHLSATLLSYIKWLQISFS